MSCCQATRAHQDECLGYITVTAQLTPPQNGFVSFLSLIASYRLFLKNLRTVGPSILVYNKKNLLARTKMLALVQIRLKARTGVPDSDFIFQLF